VTQLQSTLPLFQLTVAITHWYITGSLWGGTYFGQTNRGSDCQIFKPRDLIKVYYPKPTPSISEARDPYEALVGELTAVALAAFFLPPAIILLGFLNWSRFKQLFGK
jgi:hypothetical protein